MNTAERLLKRARHELFDYCDRAELMLDEDKYLSALTCGAYVLPWSGTAFELIREIDVYLASIEAKESLKEKP